MKRDTPEPLPYLHFLFLFLWKNYIYIYIQREREKMKNKVIQREEFNVKESQRYNVSVLLNHHQDLEIMISSDFRSPIDF